MSLSFILDKYHFVIPASEPESNKLDPESPPPGRAGNSGQHLICG
jgi:hypothetical protein